MKTPMLQLACVVLAVTTALASGSQWWKGVSQEGPVHALAAVFGEKADAWKVAAGQFAIAPDPATGAEVLSVGDKPLQLDGQTRYSGGQEIRARLRLRSGLAPHPAAHFYFAQNDPALPGYYFTIAAARGYDYVNSTLHLNGKTVHDNAALAQKLDWTPTFSNSFLYYLRAYVRILPGWEETYRARIEQDMSKLPGLEEKWLDVRIEFRKGLIRTWIDDRLVTLQNDPSIDPQGNLKIHLSPGVQLASYTIDPLREVEGFLPIRLAGYANARALLGEASVDPGTLPPAGKIVTVGGVPFDFAGINGEGHDHIDVGRSLFRQANGSGYFPSGPTESGRWYGAGARDPARIQLRIPNDLYDALYLIAASDGEPNSVPLVSAMFYRPSAGYPQTFETSVPLATATSTPDDALPLPVTLSDGKKVNLRLVKIPLDPETFTSFADLDIIEIELTKKIYQYRSYPDPISYGYHQGGLPSGVHVYAATLSRSPIVFDWQPARFGHVWTAPEVASYTASLSNRSPGDLAGTVTVTTRSYDGTEQTTQQQPIKAPAGQAATIAFSLPVKLNGYHDIVATLEIGGETWTEKRSFVRLAPDTRSVRWTEGKGAMFGYWSYHGGHHTPKADHHVRLMTLAGARQAVHPPHGLSDEINALILKHWGKGQSTGYYVAPRPWAAEENYDPAKVQEIRDEILKAVQTWEKDLPPEHATENVSFFAEPHITPRLTAGNFPEYWNGEPFVYTEEEKKRLRMFFETSRLAAEFIRKELPGRKIMIPWGDPGFVIPLLRAGFPKDLIDGSSIDVPNFERLPEMQLYDNAVHRMYELVNEYRKAGIDNPALWYCEGIFVPTEVGAVSWREQMDIYNRWSLIALAYGVQRFYSGWFAFDSGNYYGSEHYGGCGIQRRIPYCDPKPAYAAFATMTDKLNEANFDGWIHTGSLTTFCLRFKHETRGYTYALWTIRGKRPVTLKLAADATVQVTDTMNNSKAVASKELFVDVMTDQSVIYVSGGEIASAQVGAPDNSDAQPASSAAQVADLGDGSWSYTSRRDEIYENNHWGFYPYAGKFSATTGDDPQHGRVMLSKLEKQDVVRELMPWYNILKPAAPVTLPAAPSHIGLWVRGSSDWGRVIYILRDANNERWISIGTKDDYNCNDPHSWASINFDGWRYLRFELPGHIGWDNFRKHGTTWYRSDDGDGVVDLPLRLEEIIVEQRSHILYVNDVQPVASDTIALGKLYVEYASPWDATEEAVAQSRLRMPRPTEVPDLPNPIAKLQGEGVGEPLKPVRLTPPEHYYDGTRMHVHFEPAADAKTHHLWVGAYPDGRGAINLVPAGVTPGQLVTGLRPGLKLYYWITYTGADDKPSKPSPRHEEVTVDNFKEK